MLSMPLTFLVPVILVRSFNVEEFGLYKQIFLFFHVFLPFIDLGISQSLLYLLPKYIDRRDTIISQTIVMQLPIFILLFCGASIFSTEIGHVIGGNESTVGTFVPCVCIFAMLWHMSNILEGYLIVEGLSFQAGIITFLSETVRALVTISISCAGGGIGALIIGFILISFVRLFMMGIYFYRISGFKFSGGYDLIYKQLSYSVPFGIAVIVSTLVIYSHQYIVSYFSSLSDFAIYSVGCFSLPFLPIMAGSVSKISLVKMSDIVADGSSVELVADILQNSIRKLWLIFFPIFVWLYVLADKLVVILYTDTYLDAVPVFRIFIVMIPLSAFLVQHVPRAFGETSFILYANSISLLVSIALCYSLLGVYGLTGAAGGVVLTNALWRILFVLKCKKLIAVPVKKMIPINIIAKSGILVCGVGLFSYVVGESIDLEIYFHSSIITIIYFMMCVIVYWYSGFLLDAERQYIVNKMQQIVENACVGLWWRK